MAQAYALSPLLLAQGHKLLLSNSRGASNSLALAQELGPGARAAEVSEAGGESVVSSSASIEAGSF